MPLPNYGTNTTFDELAASNETIAQFGEDRAWDAINAQFEAHEEQVGEMLGDLVDTTTDKFRRYGTNDQMKMVELDQFGVADSQKIRAGSVVGFPLRLYGGTLQYSRKALQNMKANQLAANQTALLDADVQNLILQMKIAIFRGTNYTWRDTLVQPHVQFPIPCKALCNADGAAIPNGPNNISFNANTHNHYLNSTSLTSTFMDALVGTVTEHYSDGELLIYIPRANEDAVKALQGFTPYPEQDIIYPNSAQLAAGLTLNPLKVYNRAIGRYKGGQVWVKPWIPDNYFFPFLKGQRSPLALRKRSQDDGADDTSGAFALVFDDEDHPLRAKGYEREFGISVQERTNGAVGYVGNGGNGYLVPSYN